MSPRRYDRRLRQAASEEARRRIVEAAATLRRLAAFKPRTLALMHGSSWKGDGEKLLNALADLLAVPTR